MSQWTAAPLALWILYKWMPQDPVCSARTQPELGLKPPRLQSPEGSGGHCGLTGTIYSSYREKRAMASGQGMLCHECLLIEGKEAPSQDLLPQVVFPERGVYPSISP